MPQNVLTVVTAGSIQFHFIELCCSQIVAASRMTRDYCEPRYMFLSLSLYTHFSTSPESQDLQNLSWISRPALEAY
jgi:hypothetical protein